MCTPPRDDNKVDDRRSCKLKIPSLNGGFLVPSSISKVNKKRENWIRTDTECKSRCYSELIYSILFLSLSQEFSYRLLAFADHVLELWRSTHCNKPPLIQPKFSRIEHTYIYTYLQNHCLVMCSEIVRLSGPELPSYSKRKHICIIIHTYLQNHCLKCVVRRLCILL